MYRHIWNYYHNLANLIGIKPDGGDYSYSLRYFYEGMEVGEGIDSNLNTLSKAFLGEAVSRQNVNRASLEEVNDMCIRVQNICDANANHSQIEAVAQAILNDVTLIQGPPGTGKTETIKNIILCIRQLFPQAAIAVISANGEAIRNAIDAVNENAELRDRNAYLGAKNKRKEFKNFIEENKPDLYQELTNARGVDWNEETETLEKFQFPDLLLEEYPIIFSTIHSIRKSVKVSEYDYVIVDECSQVPSVLGMVAISLAKHLVLLGDDEQLPPIHKEDVRLQADFSDIRETCPWYIDEKDNSFMKACKKSFADSCACVLLNEHYRCHPSIIGFCNQYIYDNRLIARSNEDGKLPIRIRWYEGEYWERIKRDEQNKSDNYNKKQIEIFVKEEYPEILEILTEHPDYSVCVLSPYRKQLELLKERLDGIRVDNAAVENNLEDVEGNEAGQVINDIPQLTIHKAQGRGYDRVYILPVEDTGCNPWSQKKELINVAVSRAKKELCVITSSIWMPKDMQKELLGYCIENDVSSDNGYLKKLLEYVKTESEHRQVEEKYGFIRSGLISVFDKVPYYRRERNFVDNTYAPELCMKKALEACTGISGEFKIYREVPLSAFEGIQPEDDEVRKYIENGARFDFVIAKENRVYAIIEVDGSYHRYDAETIRNDELKNQAVGMLGEEFAKRRFFRFPTDGTTWDELEKIIEATDNSVNVECLCNIAKENCGMEILDQKIQEAYDFLTHELNAQRFEDDIKSVGGFANGNIVDYTNDIQAALYFLRYSKFYSLEYFWMYDLALQILNGNNEGEDAAVVYSFGSGSNVDAISLLEADRKLRDRIENYAIMERLYYRGIDICRWSEYALINLEGIDNLNARVFLNGMVDFWNDMSKFMANILFFPKILSEHLDEGEEGETIIDQFCNNLAAANLDREKIVLCVSYRGTNTYDEDAANTNRIIDAMIEKGYEVVDYNLNDYTWEGRDYFEYLDEERKVFRSIQDVRVDYERYADFNISEDIRDYLERGEIRRICQHYDDAYRRNQEDNNYNDSFPRDVCQHSCVNYRNCARLIPRKNLNSGDDRTCFQILLFRRRRNG